MEQVKTQFPIMLLLNKLLIEKPLLNKQTTKYKISKMMAQ